MSVSKREDDAEVVAMKERERRRVFDRALSDFEHARSIRDALRQDLDDAARRQDHYRRKSEMGLRYLAVLVQLNVEAGQAADALEAAEKRLHELAGFES